MDTHQHAARQEHITAAIAYGIPEYTAAMLADWVYLAHQPSGFLSAVLGNDLCKAFGKADSQNQATLHNLVNWIYNHCPIECHSMTGADWTKWKGLEAMQAKVPVLLPLSNICNCLDDQGIDYDRMDVALTLDNCMTAEQAVSISNMITKLGYKQAVASVAHDLGGYKDIFNGKPGSDCWVARSNGF